MDEHRFDHEVSCVDRLFYSILSRKPIPERFIQWRRRRSRRDPSPRYPDGILRRPLSGLGCYALSCPPAVLNRWQHRVYVFWKLSKGIFGDILLDKSAGLTTEPPACRKLVEALLDYKP